MAKQHRKKKKLIIYKNSENWLSFFLLPYKSTHRRSLLTRFSIPHHNDAEHEGDVDDMG